MKKKPIPRSYFNTTADRVLFPELNDHEAMRATVARLSSDDSKPIKDPKKPISTKPTPAQTIKPESYTYKNGLALDFKPISKIGDIFADMTDRALTKMNKADKKKQDQVDSNDRTFLDFLDHLNGRKLRVATMCSGTESPILALNLVSEGKSLSQSLSQPLLSNIISLHSS